MRKRILKFIDVIVNFTKEKLGRFPISYAFIVGIGVVLFWRGVWHTADSLSLSGFVSLVLGFLILLFTGVFISEFIGNKLIISGLLGEKRIEKKEEGEIETEEVQLRNLQNTLNRVESKLGKLEDEVEKNS